MSPEEFRDVVVSKLHDLAAKGSEVDIAAFLRDQGIAGFHGPKDCPVACWLKTQVPTDQYDTGVGAYTFGIYNKDSSRWVADGMIHQRVAMFIGEFDRGTFPFLEKERV